MTHAEAEGVASGKRWSDGLTPYHYLVLVVACFGWLFDTMDQWLYVAARQPAMAELLNLPPSDPLVASWVGWATTWMIIGWAVGGLFFGMVGDRIGRTWTMALTILLYAGFTGLSGLSQSPQQLTIFRFLTGLGIGGEFAAGASLVAETFPAHSRALALAVVQATSALGNVMAGFIWLYFGPIIGWRGVFFIGVIPAFLLFIILGFIKEPEAWRVRRAEAKAGLVKMGSFLDLFGDRELRRNALVGLVLASVGVIGFWGIGVWSSELIRSVVNPENLESLRAQADRSVGWVIMAQNAGAFFGALAFAYLAQKFGRRPAFAISLIACAVVVPSAFYFTQSFATAIVMFALMGFALLVLFGGYAVYFPELFPTRLRSTGTGFCYNVARFIAASAPWTLGLLIAPLGLRGAVLALSGIFLLALLVLPFAPETRGKSLMD
jgi:MFS family permease